MALYRCSSGSGGGGSAERFFWMNYISGTYYVKIFDEDTYTPDSVSFYNAKVIDCSFMTINKPASSHSATITFKVDCDGYAANTANQTPTGAENEGTYVHFPAGNYTVPLNTVVSDQQSVALFVPS